VTNANQPLQTLHMAHLKDIADQAFTLALVKLAVLVGHDACGILAAVLQYRQCVVKVLIDVTLPKNTYDATHSFFPYMLLKSALAKN
jgi:hypothetical protein